MFRNRSLGVGLLTLAAAAFATSSYAAPGDHIWSRGVDSQGFAATDGSSNVGCAGNFFGMMSFGGPMHNSVNAVSGDIFIARYSANGMFQWSRSFTPGNNGAEVTAVEMTPSGSLYVAGRNNFNSGVDFGGGQLLGTDEMWIAKFDEFGNLLWNAQYGPGTIFSLDGDVNYLAVAGETVGDVDFGGGVIVNQGLNDAFAALLHGGGVHIWSEGFGDPDNQRTSDIAVDPDGTTYFTGGFQGTVDFGGGALTPMFARPDLFIVKYDPTGSHVWSNQYTRAYIEEPSIASISDLGRVVVTGSFDLPINLGNGAFASVGGLDVFLLGLNDAGTSLWTRSFGTPNDDEAQGVQFDGGGNVVHSGIFRGMINFGGGNHVSNGLADVYLAGTDIFGGYLWSKTFGTAMDDLVCRTNADPNGHMVVHGTATNGIDFGGGAIADAQFYYVGLQALFGPLDAPAIGEAASLDAVTIAPNPFSDAAEIRFGVARAQHVDVAVHDVQGRRVRTLAAREFPAGSTTLSWDGRDDGGRELAAGIYYWRVASEEGLRTGKVTRLK